MQEIILFLQTNAQILLTGAFWLGLVVLFVNQLRILHRTRRLENNIEEITGRVMEYLAVVMGPESGEEAPAAGEVRAAKKNLRNEEEDSRLISAVLQEIFP